MALYTTPKSLICNNIKLKGSCWIWAGTTIQGGYGRLGKTVKWCVCFKERLAHRLSYIIYNGDFDRSLQINHKCNNASCVNPRHLYAGTQKDNVRDMKERGTFRYKIPPGEVCIIKELYKNTEITQLQLALRYKVHPSTISRIITGSRGVKVYG